jgi:general stress protein 26
MKIETQHSAQLTQLGKLLEPMAVAMLTNLDSEGKLVSRPMSPLEMDDEGSLWFFTDSRSTKLEHLHVVNLSFSDIDKGTYVSLSGRGAVHNDRTHIARLWTPFAKPWFPDGPDSVHLALLEFIPEIAEFWDAPHSKMVRMFAMAASVAAGKPIAMGDHDKLTELSQHASGFVS